jgi:hypothetical protein
MALGSPLRVATEEEDVGSEVATEESDVGPEVATEEEDVGPEVATEEAGAGRVLFIRSSAPHCRSSQPPTTTPKTRIELITRTALITTLRIDATEGQILR